MQTVQTKRLAIGFEDTGKGDPVLLVHGWPDSARGWSTIADGLTRDGWRVIVPDLRGSGTTRFVDDRAVRDGSAAALVRDVLDVADHLGLDRFAVVGHDWGARTAYSLAAFAPARITSVVALALGYQPHGAFVMPNFRQAQRFWYQWLMYVGAGVEAIIADPVGFAREQWESWSPPGWFDDDVRAALAETERIEVPTLMIQGAADECDPPETSDGLDVHFVDYRRVVLEGVGHFPHREAPQEVLTLIRQHLART